MLDIMSNQAHIRELQREAQKQQAKRDWLRRGKR